SNHWSGLVCSNQNFKTSATQLSLRLIGDRGPSTICASIRCVPSVVQLLRTTAPTQGNRHAGLRLPHFSIVAQKADASYGFTLREGRASHRQRLKSGRYPRLAASGKGLPQHS